MGRMAALSELGLGSYFLHVIMFLFDDPNISSCMIMIFQIQCILDALKPLKIDNVYSSTDRRRRWSATTPTLLRHMAPSSLPSSSIVCIANDSPQHSLEDLGRKKRTHL
jgi:hypothetical protein